MTVERDFTRQSFLGPRSEEILANTRVTVIGASGGGSHILQQLAHLGVGKYRVIDPQCMDASNLNRLVGGTQADVDNKTLKAEIAKRTIQAIRPWATVEVAAKKWQEVDHLIRDSHVIFGCVDGMQARDYLEGAARRFGLPYIDVGMDVTEIAEGQFAVAGQMIMTRPGGPCMRCLGFITDDRLNKEEDRYGDAGINPQVVWTNGTLASLAVGAFVKLFTPWTPSEEAYTWLELDGNAQTVVPSRQPNYMPMVNPCPHRTGRDALGDPFFSLPR